MPKKQENNDAQQLSRTDEKRSTAASCALAMQRVINASRYEKSEVAEYLGLSAQTLDKRMRGLTSFSIEEVIMICKLVDISLEESMKIAGMSQEEFENAWIYQWRRMNLSQQVAHLEAEKGLNHSQIAEMIGRGASWISRALRGGEQGKIPGRTARLIEQRLDLPEGWLDRKPMTPPKGQQVNQTLMAKTSHELMAAIRTDGFDLDSDIINPYISAVVQLYNARVAMRDGYDPETDAAQFQTIYEQLTMQLKMKEGLWKHWS